MPTFSGRAPPHWLRVRQAAAFAVALTPFAAMAEDAGLALDRALALAMERNPEIREAEARVLAQRGKLVHARRPVPSNPRIGVEGAERALADDTEVNDLAVRVSQELWLGGQGGLLEEAASARAQAARRRLAFLRNSVRARVRRAFLGVLLEKEAVATAERALDLAREVEGYARERLDAGETTQLEVNVADIGAARARSVLAEAKGQLENARLELATLVARDPAAPLRVDGELAAPPLDLPPRSRLLTRSVARRGDLAAAAQEVVAAREELKLARRQLIPNLTVTGFYEEKERSDVAGVGLSMPLPLLHRYGGERQAAGGRLERAQAERDALALEVRRQVLAGLTDYQAARARRQAASEGLVRAAEANVALTREAVAAGKVGAPALNVAQRDLIDARDRYLEAYRALMDAAVALERATGGLLAVGAARGRSDSSEEPNE